MFTTYPSNVLTFVAGLSENIIAALCINKTLITLKLARNGLRKFYFSKLSYPKCSDIIHYCRDTK